MSEITVSKGGKATFSCELPDSTYKGSWNRNGNQIKHDGSRIVISQQSSKHSLVITKTDPTDAGDITFETTKGGIKVPFQLVVTEPPSIDPVEFEKCAKALENLKTGGKMILKIPFQGALPITASWKFNGKVLSSSSRCRIDTTSDSSTLTLEEFKAEDCGTYEVTLKNKHGDLQVPVEVALSDVSEVKFETVQVPGTATKKSSTMVIEQEVEVEEAPSKPAGSIKFENMSANRFTIGLTVAAPAGVTEYRVEKCEAGKSDWAEAGSFPADQKTFQISDLPVGKRYMFRVRAVNKMGESEPLESRGVNVQPPSNPPELDAGVLEQLKQEQLPKAGKEFKLKIPFVGHPLPIAQWYKDGKKLNTKGRVSSETNDTATTFSISGVSAEDSGVYNVNLKNKAGSGTAEFKLTVIDVPSAPLGPLEFELVTGSDATFTWQPPKTDGGRPLKHYEIEQKHTKSPNWEPSGKSNPDTTSFVAENLTTGMKYTFRVKAVNQEGASKPLMSQPVVASGPPGQPGAPTAGKVTASSISLTWDAPQNDGGSPVTSYNMEMKEVGGDWEKVSHKMVDKLCAAIKNLTEDGAYHFRVAAVNNSGQGRWAETSKPITAMDAPEPPVIEERIKSTLAEPHASKAGEDVVLKVPFTGRPLPTAVWQKEGDENEIKDDDASKTSKVERGMASLTLHNVQRGDSGNYKVKLTNSEGEVEATLNVFVKDIPSPPTGPVRVAKASSKMITIAWKAPKDDGGVKITQYLVERKEDKKDGEWMRAGKILPGEKLEYVSDHVDKGTSYFFRITAFNSMGNSSPLESESILADDKYKPPGSPSTPQVSDVTKSSCVLSWTVPSEDGGSPINGYMIEVKKQGRRNWVAFNENDLTLDNSNYKVTKLQEGSEYQFRVVAHNEAGNGLPGGISEKILARDPVPPPPPVSGLKVNDMTDNTVSLEWDSPPDLDKYAFNGYVVEMCKEGTTNWKPCTQAPIRTNKFKVSRLYPGDKYSFRVRGANDGGFGQAEATKLFEIRQMQVRPHIAIDETLKTTGIDLHANNTVRIVARISGKPTPHIRWLKDDIDLDRRCHITTQGGVSQMIMRNVTKADAGTYYIAAENSSGKIEIPIKLKVRDTPDPPSNITIGDLSEDGTLEVRWQPPLNDGGHPVKHYCLQMRDAYSRSFQTVQDKIQGTKYVVKNLKPGFTYYFRVIAENELGRGEGDQSNLVTVVQKRGPLKIEKMNYKKMDFQKPAQFNLALKPIMVAEYGTARFTCAVGGTPNPEIVWMKDSARIKPNHKYSMKNSYGVCTLSISGCRPRDSGLYQCIAKNPTGKATSEANLNVKVSQY